MIHRPVQAMESINHPSEAFSPRVNASRRASAMKGLPTAPESTDALAYTQNPRQDSAESKPRPRREARFADESPARSPMSTAKSPMSGTSSISRGVTQQPREQYREPSIRSKTSNKSSKSGKAGSMFRSNGKPPQSTSSSPRPPLPSAQSESSQLRGKEPPYTSASSAAGSSTSGSHSHKGTNGNSTKPSTASPIYYVTEPGNTSGSSTPKGQKSSMDNVSPPSLAPPSQRSSPQLHSPATSSKLSLPSTSIASITKLTSSDQSTEKPRSGLKFFRNPFHRKRFTMSQNHSR